MLVGFDPASGHEQQGAGRPALVLSVQAFNQLGMTLVNQVRMMDLRARLAKRIGLAADEVVEEALLRLQAVVE